MGRYNPALWRVGEELAWACFSCRGPASASAPSPSSDPLVDTPLVVLGVLDLLPRRSLTCRDWRNESVAVSERRRSGFAPGAPRVVESCLEGAVAGGDVRFWTTPKVNGFDAALLPVRGAALPLPLFRCNFLVEQVVAGRLPVVLVLVLRSEPGLGRPISAAAFFGLAGGDLRGDWCMSNV